jgi:hypothetical protein
MTINKSGFLSRNPTLVKLGIIVFLIFSIIYQSSKGYEWYAQNDCLGKNETDLDSEGWSDMDFCMDKNIGDDAVYSFFLFILLIPLVIYLLVGWRNHRYNHY